MQLSPDVYKVSEKLNRGLPKCQETATLYTGIYTEILGVKQRDLYTVFTFTSFVPCIGTVWVAEGSWCVGCVSHLDYIRKYCSTSWLTTQKNVTLIYRVKVSR